MPSLRIVRGDDYTRSANYLGNSPLGQVQFYCNKMDCKCLRVRWWFLLIGLLSLLATAALLRDVWHVRYQGIVMGMAVAGFVVMLTFWAIQLFVCRFETKELSFIKLTVTDYKWLKLAQPSAAAYYAAIHPDYKLY